MPKRKCSNVDVSLGQNLVYYRKLSGLTQQQVAQMLNLNRTTYTKYETGASEPSIEILKQLAEILNVNVAQLLEDESEDFFLKGNVSDVAAVNLNDEQAELLKLYEALGEQGKKNVIQYIREQFEEL